MVRYNAALKIRLELARGVRREGSWAAFTLVPHKHLLVLRVLCERGRAQT